MDITEYTSGDAYIGGIGVVCALTGLTLVFQENAVDLKLMLGLMACCGGYVCYNQFRDISLQQVPLKAAIASASAGVATTAVPFFYALQP